MSDSATIDTRPNALSAWPDSQGRFGDYGGRFVAETLMPNILELEAAYEAAATDTSIACLLLTGEGDNFCAGVDLNAFSDTTGTVNGCSHIDNVAFRCGGLGGKREKQQTRLIQMVRLGIHNGYLPSMR